MRLSLRTRLSLVYGSLFFGTAVLLVAVTYLFTVWAVNAKFHTSLPGRQRPANQPYFFGGPDIEHELTERRREILHGLLQVSIVATLLLGALAFVMGYYLAGRMLRPLHTVTTTARRLSETTLHERIGLDGPRDEVKELADTFDQMLDRLHRAFDSQRRFIANASHELRTPLALSRTAIEVVLARPGTTSETRLLCDRLLAANTRHERLIDGLLTLARSERELRSPVPLDVRDLAADAIGQLHPVATREDVTLHADLASGPAVGDPVLLERSIVNLVENAIRYNVPDGHVWVRCGVLDGSTFVAVDNTGPVVSPENAETIFKPFERLRGPRRGGERGAGLGLSIVRAVLEAHDGTARARPRDEGGLTVTLRLPTARLPASPRAASARSRP
ncbi:sensor histidine kinase [Actinomadura oligospora]|uniref:sensor histidine kinase n=1 Tax=Actinomadura oligospora TaxID=111804 RepID=UPI0006850DFE|nr:HAMP domain-containing sensor histidine kinase [Actinomadura oligospora]